MTVVGVQNKYFDSDGFLGLSRRLIAQDSLYDLYAHLGEHQLLHLQPVTCLVVHSGAMLSVVMAGI